MRIVVLSIVLAGCLIPTVQLRAQGCSDAGFCTLQSIKPTAEDSASMGLLNSLKVGGSYGKGDYGVKAWAGYLEFDRSVSPDLEVSGKLTFASQSGSSATSTGISDLFLSANHRVLNAASVTLGVKIPLNEANKTLDGRSLPMDYQTSLGTLDLIIGIGYRAGATSFQAAIQQPLSNNGNGFLASEYPPGSEFSVIPSTNMFVRRGDVLLRASHRVSLTDGWTVTPGILPIYHLSDDRYTDAGGVERDISGSKGLTLNGILFVEYFPGGADALELTFGVPFITRDSRPDGLTRSYVIGVEYRHSF